MAGRAGKVRAADAKRDLEAFAAELRRRIEAEVTGLDEAPAAVATRRRQALDPVNGFEFFCRTYFPHYVKSPEPSRLHVYLYKRLPEILAAPAGQNDVIAAPRGEAKSTLTTQLFSLWCIAKRAKWYILILMDAFDQAAQMVEAIKAELETNPRLALDFPDITGAGRVWKEGVAVSKGGVKIEGAGSGKRLRGRRHGPHRPDLVVLDDIENDENTRSPDQRDKLEGWVDKAVLNVGAADGSLDVVYIGTTLHYDGVLARKMRNPLWKKAHFASIVRWPDRRDLWDQWEERLRNDGPEAADAFHLENLAAMAAGAVVSWPSVRPLVALMRLRVKIGHAAFDSEQQNDPVSGEDALFGTPIFWTILAWMEELPALMESAKETALAWKDALEPLTSAIGAIVEQIGPMNASLGFLSILIAGKLIPVFIPLIRLTWMLGRAFTMLTFALARMAFGPLIASFGRMFTAIRAGTGVMAAFNAVMLANPIGLVVAAVAALAGAAYLMHRNWDDVGPWFGRLWDSVERRFNGVVEFMTGVFTADWRRAWDGLKEIAGGWRDWIVTIWSGVYGAFRAFVGWLDKTFGTRFASALDGIEAKTVEVVDKLAIVWEPIKAAWDGISSWVRNTFAPAMQSAVQYVSDLIKPIIDAIAATIAGISQGIDTVIDSANRAGAAVDRAGAAARQAIPGLGELPAPLKPVPGVANPRNPAAGVGAFGGSRSSPSSDADLVFGRQSSLFGRAGGEAVDVGGELTIRIDAEGKVKDSKVAMNDRRLGVDVSAGQYMALS